jgi:hypothetical protein
VVACPLSDHIKLKTGSLEPLRKEVRSQRGKTTGSINSPMPNAAGYCRLRSYQISIHLPLKALSIFRTLYIRKARGKAILHKILPAPDHHRRACRPSRPLLSSQICRNTLKSAYIVIEHTPSHTVLPLIHGPEDNPKIWFMIWMLLLCDIQIGEETVIA